MATTGKKSSKLPIVGYGLLTCMILAAGAYVYCLVGAPEPVSAVTRKTSLDLVHACGITAFDPPADTTETNKVLHLSDLPEGCYIYAGPRPSQTAPRWVVVNPGGTITWLDVKRSADFSTIAATSKPEGEPAVTKPSGSSSDKPNAAQGQESHFESYNYPMIKWQAKPLNSNGGVAQLWTTYDSPTPGQEGNVKFRLTLFKSPNKSPHRIQLLDEGGFKIMEFKASDFDDVPGTQLMEARESFSCPEAQYRQARDYAIN
jgi:hypothetical protein